MSFKARTDPRPGQLDDDRIRISGHIVDVSPQAFRVAGLSSFVRLGDCIVADGPEGEELGEVVRIEENAATVKPFAVRFQSGVRSVAWRTGPVTLSPGGELAGAARSTPSGAPVTISAPSNRARAPASPTRSRTPP